MIVTTGDIRQDYEILGPVYFQVAGKVELASMWKQREIGEGRVDMGQSDFEKAFFVAVKEIEKRAAVLGGDAVIGMRQDTDMEDPDTAGSSGFVFFYLQMYGTAVKLV